MRRCCMPSCEKPHVARGYCKIHWQRWRRTGNPKATPRRIAPGWRRRSVPAVDRVMRRTERRDDGCLVFVGHCDPRGYGQVRGDSTAGGTPVVGAHVVVATAVHGPRPSPDHEVLHSCDNPPCVEPTHLRWGTHAENMRDCVLRGRAVPPPRPKRRGDITTEELF